MSELENLSTITFTFDRKTSSDRDQSTPTLSVICINKNDAKYLEDNILSVLSQHFNDFEFLMADGGSTDASLEIIARYDCIKLVPGRDTSRGEGIVRAIAAARGRYVMFTTSTDGYLSRDWFRKATAELDNNPAISMIFGASATMSSEGLLGNIVFPKANIFYKKILPEQWAHIWLLKGISNSYYPELNYCVRRSVIQKLVGRSTEFPELDDIDPILRFHFQFNRYRYLPKYLPVLANFGRVQENNHNFSESHQQHIRTYVEAWKKFQKGVLFRQYKFKKNGDENCLNSCSIFLSFRLTIYLYFINPINELYNKLKNFTKRAISK